MAQKKVALACSVCGSRNYTIAYSPNRTHRLEVKKFCKHCGKYTMHQETR
ncbi:50S ribosomal protein L33 [Secundilactobacillus oryzae JCM 18671]|uniref:Large ribosomal subunit protein bL33 n=1 Tax=Secundilactobacillus oryzae JCM 18671 TaxID=1291743 RepID=A0A081BJC4_9LACO|nr:50S ribosomal protein L33 [Secundilactobacillus oryzae]GAK48142.1 50S ribosomal protein L33 [Secundilactobacillus oryzae JCM 18671]